jgi:saccharopine dehydrogenase-like NADP-dependent oxidoreductase
VVADIDVNKEQDHIQTLKSNRVSFDQVDVRNHKGLINALKGVTVALNSTWIELYMPIFLAPLEVKLHYVDLGGFFYGNYGPTQVL